jgi:hypothetical protein
MICHEVFWLARPQLAANGHEPEDDLFTAFSGSKHQAGVFLNVEHR